MKGKMAEQNNSFVLFPLGKKRFALPAEVVTELARPDRLQEADEDVVAVLRNRAVGGADKVPIDIVICGLDHIRIDGQHSRGQHGLA